MHEYLWQKNLFNLSVNLNFSRASPVLQLIGEIRDREGGSFDLLHFCFRKTPTNWNDSFVD